MKRLRFVPVLFLALSAVATGAAPPARRIIACAPNLTEIVFDLGAGDLLVGDTKYCMSPPEALLKPKVCDFLTLYPERIARLKPDLALMLRFQGERIGQMERLGVPTLVLDDDSVGDVYDSYEMIGRWIGREKEARSALKRLRDRLEAVRARAVNRRRVSVLFVVGRGWNGAAGPMLGAGKGSFIDDLIALAGGENILSGVKQPYPFVSKEFLLKRDPDVIVESIPRGEARRLTAAQRRKGWETLGSLKAVREGRLYFLDHEDGYLVPGPGMSKLAEYLEGLFAQAGAPKN